ncbi:MAG TPA: DUF3616 domain-containing protein [Blastocatellia bacterium]|nr:DUF3616 domain-containing protein [Blastocatellia bacterium]
MPFETSGLRDHLRISITGVPARRGLSVAFFVTLLLLFPHCRSRESSAISSGKSKNIGAQIQGGTFEASGAVFVPGTNGILFIDDGRTSEVLWMQLDVSGNQVGAVKSIPLGVTIEDPEGITFDGSLFYIVGSQSSRKSDDRGGIVRFGFDPKSQTVTNVEILSGLRAFLVRNVPELRENGDKKGAEGGLNIEGIAWDPEGKRLLLGLRSPLAGDQALVVPVRLRDPNARFTIENLELDEPNVIKLLLGGAAIRDIQYDSRLKSFLIIAGAPEHHEKVGFSLWQWSGSSLGHIMDLARKMKPEGVTHVEIRDGDATQEFIFIVGDASVYQRVDYSELP